MYNLLKNKKLKFNSKKGFTLLELIVAVMILLIVISASVRGISISYRSALLGAEKNDAQSLAQRNCDIIMSALTTHVENKKFTDTSTLDGMVTINGNGFEPPYRGWIYNDIKMVLDEGGYDTEQYKDIQQVLGGDSDVKKRKENDAKADKAALQPVKKYQYFTLDCTERQIGSGPKHQVYKVTTYVYYTDNGFVTCEGEVSVIPKK